MDAFLKFVTTEWYFAIPMISMSLIGVALITWRILLNLSAKTNLDEVLPAFQARWEREGEAAARKYCKEQTALIPNKMFVAGLDTRPQGMAAVKRAMATTIELDILPTLNYLMPTIIAIAKIATMVGLLGTVISMIGTFNEIGKAAANPGGGGGGVTASADKIGLALFATMLGLATAIPLVFAHVQFKAGIHKEEIKMKSSAQKFIMIVTNIKPGSNPYPDEPPPEKDGKGGKDGRGGRDDRDRERGRDRDDRGRGDDRKPAYAERGRRDRE